MLAAWYMPYGDVGVVDTMRNAWQSASSTGEAQMVHFHAKGQECTKECRVVEPDLAWGGHHDKVTRAHRVDNV